MQLDLPGTRVERTSDGHTFFFESQYGYAYVLSDTSALLVEMLLTEDCDQEALIGAIRERFKIEDEMDIRRDVARFIDDLRRYGLLA